MIKVYSLDGKFLKDMTFEDLLNLDTSNKNVSTKKQNISTALNGYKGYGYYAGYWISNTSVKIMTPEESMIHFNDWCNDNLRQVKRRIKQINKEWDEDVYSTTLLDLCEAIISERGVNNPEGYLTYKYRTNTIDNIRAVKCDMRAVEVDDLASKHFDILYHDDYIYYRTDEAEESLFDDNRVHACLEDINNMKKFEVLQIVLYEFFSEEEVKMWINYEVKTKGTRKTYKASMQEFGYSKDKVRKTVRAVEAKLKELQPIIFERYNELKYPTFDEMTLKNIIND